MKPTSLRHSESDADTRMFRQFCEQYLASSERRAAQASGSRLGLSPRECAQWTFTGAALARVHGQESFETECSRALDKQLGESARVLDIRIPREVLEHRVLDVVPGAKGGYLVGPSSESYFDTFRNRSVLFRAGMQYIPDQFGDVRWPRRTSAATSAWLTPGVAVSDSDPTYGQLTAMPRTCMVITKSSLQLEAQISPTMEALNRNSLVNDQTSKVDLAGLNGAGGPEPLGVLNASGIGSASGASSDFAKVIKPQTDVADANGVMNVESLSYVTTPLVAGLYKGKQRFAGTDSPLWAGGISVGSIEGVKALSTKNMPANTLLFGDFSQLMLIDWGPMSLSIDRSTGFNTGQVGIRLLWMVDFIVVNPLSFTKLTSIS